MQIDDTKHKVYIYDLDAELSDSDSDDGKLVFLPDIQKHLRESRIPPSILANSEGEFAGNNQLVLYNVPSSLSVPEEQDSVRKAIIETRARARARQEEKQMVHKPNTVTQTVASDNRALLRDWNLESVDKDALGVPTGFESFVGGSRKQSVAPLFPAQHMYRHYSQQGYQIPQMPDAAQSVPENDPDSMDLG